MPDGRERQRVLAATTPDPPSAILECERAAARPLGRKNQEEAISMRRRTGLPDVAVLIAGVYAALSPTWLSTTGERGALWALIVLGALLAVAALVRLAMPGVVATEWLTVLFGVLLFIAPWVLTYTDRTGASWTSWAVGAIAAVLGGSTVSVSNRAHQQAIQH
jgi:hypothetical protein